MNTTQKPQTLFISVFDSVAVSEELTVQFVIVSPDGIMLAEFRMKLGSNAANLSEKEIKRAYIFFEHIADCLFDKWASEKNRLKDGAENDTIKQ